LRTVSGRDYLHRDVGEADTKIRADILSGTREQNRGLGGVLKRNGRNA